MIINLLKSIRFTSPKKCRVLVYDRNLLEVVHNVFLSDIDYEVLYIRQLQNHRHNNKMTSNIDSSEKLYLGVSILLRMICNIHKVISYGNGMLSRNILKRFFRYFFLCQKFACIDVVSPKIIFSYLDHHGIYFSLARCFPNIQFIIVQHGSVNARLVEQFNIKNARDSHLVKNVSHYCFGDYYKELYENVGYRKGCLVPAGSLIVSYAYENFSKNLTCSFDICIVSEYRLAYLDSTLEDGRRWEDVFGPYITSIATYSNKMNFSVCVLLRTASMQEKNYYRNILGKNVFFFENRRDEFSSYKGVLSSKMVVSTCSTMGVEALGMKKRIFIYDWRCKETSLYMKYFCESDVFYTRVDSYSVFEKKLDHLFSLSDAEYEDKIKKARCFYMRQDLEYPLYKKIQNQIEEIVSK